MSKTFNIFLWLFFIYPVDIFLWCRGANYFEDFSKLIHILSFFFFFCSGISLRRWEWITSLPWEKRLSISPVGKICFHHCKKLCKYATYRPYIDRITIHLIHQYNLWCPIPSCHNMLRKILAHDCFLSSLCLFEHTRPLKSRFTAFKFFQLQHWILFNLNIVHRLELNLQTLFLLHISFLF